MAAFASSAAGSSQDERRTLWWQKLAGGEGHTRHSLDATDAGVSPREVAAGAYVDASEVVQVWMRKLMEECAVAFLKLKADLEAATEELERGGGASFDPQGFELDTFRLYKV